MDVGHEGVKMRPALRGASTASKNMSMSIVLPRPTGPWM